MALQIDVAFVDVVPEGNGGMLTLNLKCWEEAANPPTDDPVIDVNESEYIKKGVEGLTAQQLVNRASTVIGEKFQQRIDVYKKAEQIEGMVPLAAIQAGLVG